jgi:DeoR family transcriptional regulator of aga operon
VSRLSGIGEHERAQQVLQLLDIGGRVSVTDLSARFGVSAVTVRKDLESLERRHLLRRVRGGAVAADGGDEGAFEMRLRLQTGRKQAIAESAARLVRDGDAIALDCSTTCYYLAERIRDRRGLVVVTNGLRAAELLSESDAITVVVPGGTVRRSSWSLVGDFGDVFSSRGRLASGFFGLRSLSVGAGLLELSTEETGVKRRLASVCAQVYGLFDSSKIDRFALHPFASTSRITGLITDDGAPDDFVAAWRRAGVPVTRAAELRPAEVVA